VKNSDKVALELTREQANAVMRATELLARLHIGQFKEVTWEFIKRIETDGKYDDEKRDLIDRLLYKASDLIFDVENGGVAYDDTFNRCWAVYTTIRHALAWYDFPKGGMGVQFNEPIPYDVNEDMPKCKIISIHTPRVGET